MSEFVIMPKQDYVDACNAIRAKTGKTDLIPSGALKPEIDSISGTSDDVRYVTFMSEDGSEMYGVKPVAVGDDCADPITRGVFSTPAKESTAQYNFTHYGWSLEANGATDANALKAVTEDRTVYATFASVLRSYFITFYDSDGTTVLNAKGWTYGTIPSYTPTKDGYDFTGWTPEPVAVTGDASYCAQWKVKASFETATWAEIAEVCDAGNAATTFKIGDRKPVTLTYTDGTSETIYFRIIDMGVDQKEDGTYAPLTLMADNLVKDSLQPASAYNKGSNRFWDMDNAKSRMESLYNALPADFQAVIKSVEKNSLVSSIVKVFIPSRKNLFGTEGTGTGANGNIYNLPQKQYAYFADGASVKRTKLDSDLEDAYWTCSVKEATQTSYWTVYYEVVDGTDVLASKESPMSKSYGVCPCVCI